MRRIALALAVGLGLWARAMVSDALALPVPTGSTNDPTIVVGVVATLSGPGATAGQDMIDGFTIAMRHLGGRFANQEIRLVINDDHGSPDTALQATRRMLEHEKVDMMLTAVSQASLMAIIKPLVAARVFVINLDNAPAPLAGAECSSYLFQIGTPAEAIHEAAGQYFTNEKLHRIVMIGPDSPMTGDALAALKHTFTGEVAATLIPHHGAATFQAEIARLRELKPDAVYTVLTGGMEVDFVRQFDQAGLKSEIPLVGPWSSFERPLLPAMADSGMDAANIAPWSPDLDTPLNRRMVTDFEVEYGRPATGWAAQGYDAAQWLDGALKATGGRTNDQDLLRAALRRAEFSSVRGVFHFGTNHVPVVNVYLRRVVRDAKGRYNHEQRGVILREWRDREAGRCPMRWVDEPLPASKSTAATPAKPAAVAKPPKKLLQ